MSDQVSLVIRTLCYKRIELNVPSITTILEVKQMIFEQCLIPISYQMLELADGVYLDNDKTIADYHITTPTILSLVHSKHKWEYEKNETVTLFINSLCGEVLPLVVPISTTVLEVKQMIHEHYCIPIADQKLVFAGRVMENSKTIADYHIVQSTCIHLITTANTKRHKRALH